MKSQRAFVAMFPMVAGSRTTVEEREGTEGACSRKGPAQVRTGTKGPTGRSGETE